MSEIAFHVTTNWYGKQTLQINGTPANPMYLPRLVFDALQKDKDSRFDTYHRACENIPVYKKLVLVDDAFKTANQQLSLIQKIGQFVIQFFNWFNPQTYKVPLKTPDRGQFHVDNIDTSNTIRVTPVTVTTRKNVMRTLREMALHAENHIKQMDVCNGLLNSSGRNDFLNRVYREVETDHNLSDEQHVLLRAGMEQDHSWAEHHLDLLPMEVLSRASGRHVVVL